MNLCGSLIALIFAAPVAHGLQLPPQTHGATQAVLYVRVADTVAGPGLARVELTVTVTGPVKQRILSPELVHPAGDWKYRLAASSWQLSEDRQTQTVQWWVQLDQVKSGVVPLPTVRVSVEDGTVHNFVFSDLLGSLSDPPPPKIPETTISTHGTGYSQLLKGALIGLLFLALYLFLSLLRRRSRPVVLQSSHERALARLDAVVIGEGRPVFKHISDILRNYLAERFNLAALHQPTAELLQAARAAPLSDAGRAELERLLQWCDQVKFTGVVPTAEESAQAVELARSFLRKSGKEGEATEENSVAKSEQLGKTIKEG
jgi:hypothetical protein